MRKRAADLIEIPHSLWERAEMLDALRRRDIGRVFSLVQQYTGVSQTQIAIACGTTQPKVSGLIRGESKVKELAVFRRIANGLNMPDHARVALGVAPNASQVTTGPVVTRQPDRRTLDIPARYTYPVLAASPVSDLPGAGPEETEEDADLVRRRTFVGLTGASLFGAILADAPRSDSSDAIESFAVVLAAYTPGVGAAPTDGPPDLSALAAGVVRAKRDYQACRYAQVTRELPKLLTRLQGACAILEDSARLRAFTLSAEAYHVAASVLLKAGDQGLGWLAADRSMQAARASEDPVTIASSSRIATHAMMNSGHMRAAATTASTLAATFDHDVSSHDPESLSVYGSLLLRGAVAAAQHEDRHTANELLTEAEDAGKRLGQDANLRWTAFGPTNAKLHRVNIAATLGDAGTAIDVARTVDLDKIDVTERKATFLVATARAFLQTGKHERAYLACVPPSRSPPRRSPAVPPSTASSWT
jgi:hypothetical protein